MLFVSVTCDHGAGFAAEALSHRRMPCIAERLSWLVVYGET